ncbi:hypothetical protein SAMN05421803_11768 [Nocardiopsis flavescens]|uniref:Uncharacterized protein n=1 Tax=Nocardiopsis flavescens TaxID=758803 RepID=A0A1M6REB8_9ACTN|nr:hypothetical protein [Nocardiopsis flavescens]SHK30697.1 hypothetical protein SAMN05421803_11768 [Nocardiopsis flavescens]
MTTAELIQAAGIVTVLISLLLLLAFVVLRLVALVLAAALMVLDQAATAVIRPLSLPAPATKEATP